jgi:hypothetical protein
VVPISRRIVVWEDGIPTVKGVPLLTRENVSEIALAAASLPYVDPDDVLAESMGLPPRSRFRGMTNLEVMLIRRQEEAAAPGANDGIRESILDRLIGKPKTTSENHNITESYEDACNRIARETVTRARPVSPSVMDAQVVDPDPALDGL